MRALITNLVGFVFIGSCSIISPVFAGSDATVVERTTTFNHVVRKADRYFKEKSYKRATKAYAAINTKGLTQRQRDYIQFKQLDSEIRFKSKRNGGLNNQQRKAKQALAKLANDIQQRTPRQRAPRIWADIQLAVGDAERRHRYYNQRRAYAGHKAALKWWAESTEIELARKQYLTIVLHNVFRDQTILAKATSIAQHPADIAFTHYRLGKVQVDTGDDNAVETLQTALKQKQSSTHRASIAFELGRWYQHYGKTTTTKTGRLRRVPDYQVALGYFKQAKQLSKPSSSHYRKADEQIRYIVRPEIAVNISHAYHPDTEQTLPVTWRNTAPPTLKIYPVSLNDDIRLRKANASSAWLDTIQLRGNPALTLNTKAQKVLPHAPSSQTLKLDKPLPKGMYVVEASVRAFKRRSILQVSDLAILLTSDQRTVRAWVVNSITGEPQKNAVVVHRERRYTNNTYSWKKHTAKTNDKGVATFVVGKPNQKYRGDDNFFTANAPAGQAFVRDVRYNSGITDAEQWKLYVYTDRPSYRPKQKAHWKIIARQFRTLGQYGDYQIPENAKLKYKIKDGRGKTIQEGTAELNQYGAVHGSFMLTKDMALGTARMEIRDEKNRWLGHPALFTLEEYKRPEFKVAVKAKKPDAGKRYKPGDKVKVDINANYYFGGAVSNADVEVIVYKSHHYHQWQWPHKYPWLSYQHRHGRHSYYGGRGNPYRRETLKTDANGKLSYTFPTDRNGNDTKYTIEARVIDSSRREVVSSAPLTITRKPFYAYLKPDNQVYFTGATAKLNFELMDGNQQPVDATGKLVISRGEWVHDWVDAFGNIHLENDVSCKCHKPRRYLKYTPISEETVTVKDGKLAYPVTVEKTGHYQLNWLSQQLNDQPVSASAQFWVASPSDNTISYKVGDMQLVINNDELKVGQTAHALLFSHQPKRHVLLETRLPNYRNSLGTTQAIYMEGTSQLVSFEVTEAMVPHFSLSALSVKNDRASHRQLNLTAAPEHRFIKVDISSDKAEYLPREKGKIKVKTTDHQGMPISADVSLAVVDESIYALQKSLAGDIRKAFYARVNMPYVYRKNSLSGLRYRPLPVPQNDAVPGSALLGASASGRLRDGLANKRTNGLASFSDSSVAFDADGEAEAEPAEESLAQPAPVVTLSESRTVRRGEKQLGKNKERNDGPSDGAAGGVPAADIVVRHDFRETALWLPSVITNQQGEAETEVTFPDSLTTWRLHGVAASQAHLVGAGQSKTLSKQPLIARLQAPRFLVGKDQVVISGVFNNNTDRELRVSPQLAVKGAKLTGEDVPHVPLTIPAGGQARHNWTVHAHQAGTMTVTLSGKTIATPNGKPYPRYSDAMRRNYPVYDYGVQKHLTASGQLNKTAQEADIYMTLPARRRAGTTKGFVQVTPSIATTMLDALPYLINYPYGCTEQTMSRFLPTAIVAQTLSEHGISKHEALNKAFGGISKGYQRAGLASKKQDLQQMNAMMTQGFKRLLDHQNSDGSWGWWKSSSADPYMTAYVVWGLSLAQQHRIQAQDKKLNGRVAKALQRGRAFLMTRIGDKKIALNTRSWMTFALASRFAKQRRAKLSGDERRAITHLWRNRDELSAQGRAMLALSTYWYQQHKRAAILIRNLEDGANIDDAPNQSIVLRNASSTQIGSNNVMKTAYWGKKTGWYHWADGAVESTAWVLMALSTVDANHHLVTPTMNWLVKNRRGAQWNNTRDTAMVVLALNAYLANTRELSGESAYQVVVNGKVIAEQSISARNLLTAPSQYAIPADALRAGKNHIQVVRTSGKGPLYFLSQIGFFSEEPKIKADGHELFVHRQYLHLKPTPTLLTGIGTKRQTLVDKAKVQSGHRVEVVMLVEAKNDYNYVLIEDFKPAGLEATVLKSGNNVRMRKLSKAGVLALKAGKNTLEHSDYLHREVPVYQELRDEKVANFVDRLPQGYWELRYEMRAETPGLFNALPAKAEAMYIPEVKANSTNQRLRIIDK